MAHRWHIDLRRVLELWNRGESLAQIAERFCDMTPRLVLDALEKAADQGTVALARPLPERVPRHKYTRENPAVPIPDNLPKAEHFNPRVEEILAHTEPKLLEFNRKTFWKMIGDPAIVEGVEKWFATHGIVPWNGTTNHSLVDEEQLKESLIRAHRIDLWEKCVAARKLWKDEHTSLNKREGGCLAAHKHWHIARGVVSPYCRLCCAYPFVK
jgi:hypothetical protein